ncbi:MAG TPA: hypothetical protein PLP29_13065, partial [Candidatus Ozemobacteraceae bacterium]|nr:hypothetical protein [Candidatus Ozemobacteraceae bacterium]
VDARVMNRLGPKAPGGSVISGKKQTTHHRDTEAQRGHPQMTQMPQILHQHAADDSPQTVWAVREPPHTISPTIGCTGGLQTRPTCIVMFRAVALPYICVICVICGSFFLFHLRGSSF